MVYVGVDIGGTNINSGLVKKGRIIKESTRKTNVKRGKEAVIQNILKCIKEVLSSDTKAIGIGCPGPIDLERGIIKNTPNLPLNNVNLRSIINKKFGIPVFLDNDANCFTLGEAVHGVAKNSNIVLGITLGTGVGGGIVINKKIFHGKGNAGELGHITINFNGPKSKCGNNGCLESYISARAIMKRTIGLNVKNPREIYELAEQKNKKALKILEETGFYLGVGLANLINAFHPEIIVIGGNISNSWKFFKKKLKETIKKRALFNDVKIIKSRLNGSTILGAASLCLG